MNFASRFAERANGDPLSRYYTRGSVGELLVNLVGPETVTSILDLGAGEGSLSAAAASRWPFARKVTVDVDATCIDGLLRSLGPRAASSFFHHIHNVLDPDLPLLLGRYGLFDLAVCNPPFGRLGWRDEYARILIGAHLAEACRSPAEISLETLFFAQNLRLTRDGGRIAFIAPDGLMTGRKTTLFRKHVLESHRVECVMQLPGHSFHDTEARCFILVLTKNAEPANAVLLRRFDAEVGEREPLSVSREQAIARMDYDYHAVSQEEGSGVFTLKQLHADLRRGSLSTVQARQVSYPVFHTSDFAALHRREITFDSRSAPKAPRIITAEPGDILLARVDRSLHEKVALVRSGSSAISDCVYRLRVPAAWRQAVAGALASTHGATMLKAASKGVGARLLGKADLLNLPLRCPETTPLRNTF